MVNTSAKIETQTAPGGHMRLGLGTAWFGKIPFLERRQRIKDLFKICHDAGVNYVDTAHSYFWGFAEGLLSSGIRQSGGWNPTITTKVGLNAFQQIPAIEGIAATNQAGGIDPTFGLPKQLVSELRQSIKRLSPSSPSNVLLHCPPSIVSKKPGTWAAFTELVQSFGIHNVGMSLDNGFKVSDLPENHRIPIIQVSAKDFILQNKLFMESAEVSNATIAVHRVVDLSDDFNTGLSLLSTQKRPPDIALVGTTKPERLRAVVGHWKSLRGEVV